MTQECELFKKRALELSHKSYLGGYFLFSDFLGLAELSALESIRSKLDVPVSLFGGTEGAEMVVARFGDPVDIGYEADYPIKCIEVRPKSEKFSDRLTHRDFLGALLNLGIERDVLGDIIIRGYVGYIFALEKIAPFILSSLTRVKHTDVKASLCDALPEGALYSTELTTVQVSSERLDAIVARVFHLSREDSLTYFRRKCVYVNGALCENNTYAPKPDETVSVRGLGRFIWRGFVSNTKKGKENCAVEIYR